jgi:GDP-4-dehydro-6-deoxy-D-mannose reductase
VTEPRQVLEVVRAADPDYVFHLAALIKSESLRELFAVNVVGTQNVLEALRARKPGARVLIAGSSAEYGFAQPDEFPMGEDQPLRPMTAYGLSKVAQSLLGAQYALVHGLAIVRTRTFNLTGPGEPETLVCSTFARQIAAAELADVPPVIRVGRLDSRRDVLDVRDAVAAYWLAAQYGEAGEVYNVCRGTAVRIGDVLETLLQLARVPIEVCGEDLNGIKTDVPAQQGSPEKLVALSHWQPVIPLRRSLVDLLESWRVALSSK